MVISPGSSESQLSDSSDVRQATEAERSQCVKMYIPYESAELCITQVKERAHNKYCPTRQCIYIKSRIYLSIYVF